MANYAYTFTSGDTVTPTKLNNARTVSEIVNADIKSDAAIAGSKLADGAITNAKVDAAAAIAGTKIATDFGSQNVVATGFIQSTGTGGSLAVLNGYNADGSLLQLNRGGNANQNAYIAQFQGGLFIKNLDSGAIIFTTTTSDTERMRITSGGEVYIAGTTDRGAFNLQCNGTGVWGAGAYTNGSDERLKENIADITAGLEVVNKLRPVSFNYKPEHSSDLTKQAGFVAQDLLVALNGHDYLEGTVKLGPEYYSVAYQNLIPVLAKAIQELSAKVAALEAAQS
jgi:hypothetical protein